jgi:hypothetical protein
MAVVSLRQINEVFKMRTIINIPLLVLYMLTSAILSSCSHASEQPVVISDSIDVEYQPDQQIGINEDLTIWITNQSKYCIEFPIDIGIRIVAKQTGDWIEVPNLVTYSGNIPIQLKPKGDVFSKKAVIVWPDVTGLSLVDPTDFLAIITGHLCDDESTVVEKKIPFIVIP